MVAGGYAELRRASGNRKATCRAIPQAKLDAILKTKQVKDILAQQEYNYAERGYVCSSTAVYSNEGTRLG
jgi:hypothetical protein